MPAFNRKRRTLHWPITISVSLMTLNVALMVGWIVLAASFQEWSVLTIGTVAFAVVLVGLTFYMVLTIKEVRVSRQQANFVDSVTHELKTPIASLRLYLETLQLRQLDDDRRAEFYGVMDAELKRLDGLINHLLEVGRLDELGTESEPEHVDLEQMLRHVAGKVCAHRHVDQAEVFRYEVEPCAVLARRLVLETVFGNLLDNAVKYSGRPPRVVVQVFPRAKGRVVVCVADNGPGVPAPLRKKVFKIFYRAGNELERTQPGTGLGLYIVKTLVGIMKGRVSVRDRPDSPGSVFEVELPGRATD